MTDIQIGLLIAAFIAFSGCVTVGAAYLVLRRKGVI